MNKNQRLLKILLPILMLLVIVIYFLKTKFGDSHEVSGDEALGIGIGLVFFIILFNLPSLVVCFAILISYIVFWLAKKKNVVCIIIFVLLCLLLPFLCFNVLVDFDTFIKYVEMPIVSALALIINIISLIVCGLAIREIKTNAK